MREEHGLEARLCVEDWTALVSLPKMADAVIISTQDKDHKVEEKLTNFLSNT